MKSFEYYSSIGITDGDIRPNSRYDVARRRLSGGERFLDVGCWAGTMLRAARPHYQEVVGFDIVENPVLLDQGFRVEIGDLDAEGLGCFEADTFDTVTALDVIEHVFDPVDFLRQLHRVLRPGGQALVSTPNVRHLKYLFQLVAIGRFPHTSGETKGYDGGHLHYFTHRDMMSMAAEAGFVDVCTVGFSEVGGRFPTAKKIVARTSRAGPVREFLCGGILLDALK